MFFKRENPHYSLHLHEEIELLYVVKGSGKAILDGKHYTVKEKEFFISFPNQVHGYENSEEGEYIILVLKPSSLYHYNSVFGKYQPVSPIIKSTDDDNTPYLLEEALKEFEDYGENSILMSYLTLIFGKLLKKCNLEKSCISKDCISDILTFCSENYRENISLKSISKKLHISQSHISHIFSNKIGISFCDYINSLRLTEAVKLLESEEINIAEVAEKSGFATIRTFNRVFLKHYGISPSEYKKHIINPTQKRKN